ncbi:MAG: NAD(P)-dependent oxidoreductase [Betaproteobacteria bacterium]|nr:NAD(P)-dependent oxidoreductase [Betaproteobacteria bacterium]
MRILMTGSSGPKTGATVARHLAQSHDVAGIDLVAGDNTRHVADITSICDWRPFLDGVDALVHFAALHAPHRDTHSQAAFVALNVEATARLLDAARAAGVRRFLLASTTSVYGQAMRTAPTTGRAAWVTEALVPEPEDIYDETKLAAEALCREAFSDTFTTAALRFSRCFPEPLPLMAVYRLHRGIDARDVAQAFEHALAAPLMAFVAFNVSGATPFLESDCELLWQDAPGVLEARVPELVDAFARRGWPLPGQIDRVYVPAKAGAALGFAPRFGWQHAIEGPQKDAVS